jgi:CSN8/PSMD8/EIF3K family
MLALAAVKTQFSDTIGTALFEWMSSSLLERQSELIAKAYSSITIAKCKELLGVEDERFEQTLGELGWRLDGAFVEPKRMEGKSAAKTSRMEQMAQMADVTVFLQ